MTSDLIEEVLFWTLCLVPVIVLSVLAAVVYDAMTAKTFSLRKDAWACTRSHADLVPMTTTDGKTVTTSLLPQSVCDQWSAR